MGRAAVSRQAADGRLCDITKWMAAVGTALVLPRQKAHMQTDIKTKPDLGPGIRKVPLFFLFPRSLFPVGQGKVSARQRRHPGWTVSGIWD